MPPPAAAPRRRGWIAPALAVLVAAVVAVVVIGGGSPSSDDAAPDGSPGSSTTSSESIPDPVHIESDAPTYATLDELVAASDLVVRARVTVTERGRVFGDPEEQGGDAIQSRLVGLEVAEVLAGAEPPPEFYVEEEGWLLDGAPLIVDGLAPSAEGDDAIWFLVDPTDASDEASALITVNAQGRYVVVDGGLVGAEGDDPLVARIEAISPDQLAQQVRAAAG